MPDLPTTPLPNAEPMPGTLLFPASTRLPPPLVDLDRTRLTDEEHEAYQLWRDYRR